jgi:hypothetical protein
MLQNRVDPFGSIIRTPARGAWTGNRGILHDEAKQIKHFFKLKAWITCVLHYKDKRRQVMSPNTWTELFFLDEATAFSAGHRPCFFCRHAGAMHFKQAWLAGNPQHGFNEKVSIQEIDKVLHQERLTKTKQKQTYTAGIETLPNGTFISMDADAYLVKDARLQLWSPFGYVRAIERPLSGTVTVLTPPSIVNAFRAGYIPQIDKIVI